MKVTMQVHGVSVKKVPMAVKLPDGSEAQALVDAVEVEMVSPTRAGFKLVLTGADAAGADKLFVAGGEVKLTFSKA